MFWTSFFPQGRAFTLRIPQVLTCIIILNICFRAYDAPFMSAYKSLPTLGMPDAAGGGVGTAVGGDGGGGGGDDPAGCPQATVSASGINRPPAGFCVGGADRPTQMNAPC